jgi:hypothetical protein
LMADENSLAELWTGRARIECARASRNWFGTLTLSPVAHARARKMAIARLTSGSVDFDDLDDIGQFKARHREVSWWLTVYLRRIREMSGASFRFLCVAEAHGTGLPHYHVLIHETAIPVRYDHLNQWSNGFAKWRLVGNFDVPAYIAKHLGVDPRAATVASPHYGQPPDSIAGIDDDHHLAMSH